MHGYRHLLPLALLAGSAQCLASTSIDQMRSNDVSHGLYEIREEARNFVARENARNRDQWEALEPNLKVFVPRCAVPLKARWDAIRWHAVSKSGELSQRSRRVVAVACTRTTVSASPAWDVHVPVVQRADN